MPLLKLLLGVFACATAVIWIKQSAIDPVLLTVYRLVLGTACFAPWAYADYRKHRQAMSWSHLRDSALPGLVFAAHLVTWIIGARMTLASNGVLIVNLTPIVTPFFLAALMGEHVTRREIIATLVAAMGLFVLFASDYRAGAETLAGDLMCLGSMLLLALYLSLGRKFRHHPTTLLYVTPLYASAALAALAVAPAMADPTPVDWSREWVWLALLTLLPTLTGHSLINNAMRQLRGQVVALVNMTQFIFAGVIAWVWLGEHPVAAFYPAAGLAMAGGLIAAWPSVRASVARASD